MEPLSAIATATAAKVDGLKNSLVLDPSETKGLAAVPLTGSGPVRISALVENVPLSETHKTLLGKPEMTLRELADGPGMKGLRIEVHGQTFDVSLLEGDLLDRVGVGNMINYALDPAIDQFTQLRLEAIRREGEHIGARIEVIRDLRMPTPTAVAVPMSEASRFMQALESEANAEAVTRPFILVGKRVDYLVGDQYVPGRVCELPIIGGVSNVVFKAHLGEEIQREDWARMTGDVLMVIPIVALPFVSITGPAALAGWVAANAGFGALSSGVTEYIAHGKVEAAQACAGKGAIVGAVGGVAGACAIAKIMPALQNKLLASAASGGLMGGSVSGTEATIRVVEAGEDFEAAAKEVVAATLIGSAFGAGAGAAGYGIGRIVTKLNVGPVVDSAETGNLREALAKAKDGAYFSKQHPGHVAKFEKIVEELGDIPGVRENLSRIAGQNVDVARGAYTELGAAHALKKAGHDIAAVGLKVNVPGLGKTDIDNLIRNGTWIEKKHVRRISLDDSFRQKIDKMAAAVRQRLEVALPDGENVAVRDAVFVNSGKISPNAMAYAHEKGVKILEKTPYTKVPIDGTGIVARNWFESILSRVRGIFTG